MAAVFLPDELSAATGGKWLSDLTPAGALAITTDTRCDNKGRIFFALAGERFDAHDFLMQAVDSGCEALCINRNREVSLPANIPVLTVDDTLKAMQNCAAMHRQRFAGLQVFGVTGSVGKTSVKEMLRAICSCASSADKVLYTIGNTNNQIGVGQNLFKLDSCHKFAVLEAGTSSPGEIAPLAAMIMPHGAIVNSIAPCHLEKLIDLNGVAKEKSAIFSTLPDNGVAVFPAECAGKDILRTAAGKRRIVTFGIDGKGDIFAKFISGELTGSTFDLHFPDGTIHRISWHLTGIHNAINAAGAAALAWACGIPAEIIARALPQTELPGMRMKKTVINGVTFYNDAYNANPASMLASVNLLANASLPGRLILLLGGMRELGDSSFAEHRNLLALIKEKLPGAITLTIGKEFENLSGNHWQTPEEAGKYLLSILKSGDTVFAKGSRGNAVEKALPEEAR
ncbi:MAG: UDP-N-acetylmuramoyl-tripeptide--D-alanyl-D-alanine ligase [Lentisphaeria bacterium]|nr:UDP-N-acetylmuramoyl-tripeptide--D-alanyl-D-alanine ligase [Lentisphaeria bacterium]